MSHGGNRNYPGGKTFDSSYARGSPTTFAPFEAASFPFPGARRRGGSPRCASWRRYSFLGTVARRLRPRRPLVSAREGDRGSDLPLRTFTQHAPHSHSTLTTTLTHHAHAPHSHTTLVTHRRQVIKAWTEAMQLMSVGSKWELVCPPWPSRAGATGMRVDATAPRFDAPASARVEGAPRACSILSPFGPAQGDRLRLARHLRRR